MIQPDKLSGLLERIRGASLGVVGDFCIDAYWQLDEGTPEISLETNKPTNAVTQQRYSLGGAGNVAANLAALGVHRVSAFGVIGDDLFGNAMLRLLTDAGIDSKCMTLQRAAWQTAVYAKPYRGTEEQNRIDFGRSNVLSLDAERQIIAQIRQSMNTLDGLVINQQLPRSLFTPAFVEFLNSLAGEYPKKVFLLDARQRIPDFHSMTCKLNAVETARFFGKSIAENDDATSEELVEYASHLHERMRKPVFITRSRHGILLFDGTSATEFPAIEAGGPIDPVGAGDTVVAALAGALAVGSSLTEAASLATAAAAITVRKLRQTGTASPEEILSLVESFVQRT